jgi:thiosulfate reductase cytochrome b subunit
MHWINAVAMPILIASGWAIYNDEVLLGWLHFPAWMTLGAGPEGALQWHFLAMWILAANGIAYLVYGLATARFRRMLLPVRLREVLAEVRSALALRLSHQDLTRYNAVQRLLYIGIVLVGILQVLSGLVIWKPVQLSELAALFYDFQTARLVHFLGMAAIVGFLLVHVALALLGPQTLVAMVTGGPVIALDPPADPGRSGTDGDRCSADARPTPRAAPGGGRGGAGIRSTRRDQILRRQRPCLIAHPRRRSSGRSPPSSRAYSTRTAPCCAPSTGARSCAAASASAPSPCSRAAT